MPALLSSVEQITPEWLQSVFAEAKQNVPQISRVRWEPIGAGNTGITVKVLIDYAAPSGLSAQAPASVICKFHPDDPIRTEAVKAAGVFLIESNAQKLLAKHSEAAIPVCYFAEASEDGGEFNLVCEDLSGRCELGDQVAGCSIDEAKAAIIELARLHRQFWNESSIEALTWIRPRMPFPPDATMLLEQRLSDLLSEQQHQVVRQAIPRIHEWLAREPDNQTLIHVDCRVDNVLFDHRSAEGPKAYLIDFALVTVGDALADVAYFTTSSLSPEDRLASEMELLEIHTREIAKKDLAWTMNQAVAAYEANIVSSLYLSLVAAMAMPDAPGTNLLLTRLLERNCAAVQHWMKL